MRSHRADGTGSSSPPSPDPALRELEGLTIATAAGRVDEDPLTFVFDLLVADHGATTMIVTLMGDADVEAIIRHPNTAIGSDQLGVISRTARVHPRCYGTFARILGWAVRERGLMPLPEAVRRMTSLPASVFGFHDRGRIVPGLTADLVAFDPARGDRSVHLRAADAPGRGIETVILGGDVAVDRGAVVDAHLGRVVRRR